MVLRVKQVVFYLSISLVRNESIFSEDKFLSLFFWQEFEIKTKTMGKNSKSTTILENETLIRVSDSFCSINTDSVAIDDPNQEYEQYRLRVKMYLTIFKEHIFNHDHPINAIARHFIKVFSEYIDETLKLLEANKSNIDLYDFRLIKSQEITKDLQKFIIKLQTCLRLMFCKTINYQCFIEERDEFINLITSFIFQEGRIFEKIYHLYEFSLEKEISQFKSKLEDLKNISPIDLGIHEKFSLNDSTISFQDKLSKKYEEKNKM